MKLTESEQEAILAKIVELETCCFILDCYECPMCPKRGRSRCPGFNNIFGDRLIRKAHKKLKNIYLEKLKYLENLK